MNGLPRCLLLSHPLGPETPSYGDRERFLLTRTSDIALGDICTNSRIETSVHVGTHVDLPAHFYDKGQTIDSFPVSFWIFHQVLLVEIKPRSTVLHHEVIEALALHEGNCCELLLVKTGMGDRRKDEAYWRENVGLHPEIGDFLRECFPRVRIVGFDSISVSSFTDRMTGRQAHRRFLNPAAPILLLEDLNLSGVDADTSFIRVTLAPLFIPECEALPCTVFGEIHD